ncbi:MAG TPA: alpha/beta fold hydrolase [Candidatus Eisenbacteria bacterium]|jgi:pimeloyl-ACP methyl ester carboxylesterase
MRTAAARLTLLAALLAGAAPAGAAAPPPRAIEGHWTGQLMNLRVVIHIRADADGTLRGTIDSPDQNATGLQADSVTLVQDSLHIDVASIGARFDGRFDASMRTITGLWQQGPARVPLVLRKGETTAEGRRPQDPVPPYPYQAEEVSYVSPVGGVRLAGTLTLPERTGPCPAVLLLSGSGPQDRDETIFGHRPFLVLADFLARRGIAVLRVDDRGVGGSGGQLSRATLSDLAGDALAGLAYLRARSEVDSSRIGLIGHSEGGIVGSLAAVRARGAVKFLVLLSGVGVPGDDLLRRQSATMARLQGASPLLVEKQDEIQARLYSVLKEDADSASLAPRVRKIAAELVALIPEEQVSAAGGREAVVDKQMPALLSPSFRSLVSSDPRPALAAVRCPVLALSGAKDVQVPAHDNLAAIAAALKAGGSTDVTTRELPDLNHLLQTCQTGSIAEYAALDETIAPAALQLIARWIQGKTAR